jgi:hypothetical protein
VKNGTSRFKFYLFEDAVCLDCVVTFDEYGEADVEEILLDGSDVMKEALSYGLWNKLIDCDACINNFEEDHNGDDRDE